MIMILPVVGSAQTSYEDFMKRIPPLPKDSCNITMEAANAFQNSVAELLNDVEYRINELNRTVNAGAKASEAASKEAAINQLSQQYGMSQEDINKMKSGKMSQADKQAMANRMMQQQTNMSMAEAQNFQNMSEAGKKAYAEAYAAETMAVQQSNAGKQPATTQSGDTYKLVTEQQEVMGRINTYTQKIGAPYAAISNDPSAQESLDKISKWNNQITLMMGVDYGQGKQMDSLALLVKNEQIKYCDKFTPKYRAALRNHLTVFKMSVPDQYRLGQITAEMTKASTGQTPPPESAEIGVLESLKGYLSNLGDAYKYKLYYSEDN